MNNLLSDIFIQVHNLPKHRTEEVAIFSGLVEDSFQLLTDTQLLSLYCLHKGRSVSAQLLKFLLGSCAKEQQLVVVVQLVGQLEQFHTNMVREAVSTGLRDKKLDMNIFLSNLAKLSQLESGSCHSWD
jgi:hypothetical protein